MAPITMMSTEMAPVFDKLLTMSRQPIRLPL